jgi:hypothetical protein
VIRVTSEATYLYNCIAWAAHEDDRWWWPVPPDVSYWPQGVAREETLEAFAGAYATRGFERCLDGLSENGYEKIVIYALGGTPTHAARQLLNGCWTSKLGNDVDVQHDTPEALIQEHASCRVTYGVPVQYLRRLRPR